MRLSATLPPLAALRAFEAVGRLRSFRKAGEELLITQSAVSHHIRQLEDSLGVRLFIRKARGIELTPEGETYLDATMQAFGTLAQATARLRRNSGRRLVRFSLLPSVAANWLVPRLQGFRALHPDIDVALQPTLQLVDLRADEADAALRYGDGQWRGVEARLLRQESLSPVVSPALLGGAAQFVEPRDLLRFTLLLTRHPVDWEIWSQAAGLDLNQASTAQLTDYNIALQAALDGQGVAMGRGLLVRDHLRAGRLIQPCALVATSPLFGHWLVTRAEKKVSEATRLLVEWIAGMMEEEG